MAAAAGTPRRDSHFFCLGCASTVGPTSWLGPRGSGRSGTQRQAAGPAAAGSRPVTQQHAREAPACRHQPRRRRTGRWPPRAPRRGNAVEGGWGRAAHSRKRGCGGPRAGRQGGASKPEVGPEGAGIESVLGTGTGEGRWAWRTTCPVSLRGGAGRGDAKWRRS